MIAGLFSNMLEAAAGYFLYIFIDPNANLGSKIMTKRQKQIALLQKIDKFNLVYNYSELQNIVASGIYKKYKKTPAQLLAEMHKQSIAGIGALSNWGFNVYPTEQEILESMTNGKSEAQAAAPEKLNFWDSILKAVEWIMKLLKTLGISTGNTRTNIPTYTDWNAPEAKQNASIPLILGGALALYYFSNKNK